MKLGLVKNIYSQKQSNVFYPYEMKMDQCYDIKFTVYLFNKTKIHITLNTYLNAVFTEYFTLLLFSSSFSKLLPIKASI